METAVSAVLKFMEKGLILVSVIILSPLGVKSRHGVDGTVNIHLSTTHLSQKTLVIRYKYVIKLVVCYK